MKSRLRPCSINKQDKISSLPDHLLILILSLLPTKDAAATTVLSRRWTHVFTWVTSLDFDNSTSSSCVCGLPQDDHFSTFKVFVDRVLQAHQSEYLTSFRLKFGIPKAPLSGLLCQQGCFPNLKPVHVNAWMRFPLTLGVRELDIHFRVRKPGKLPWVIFTNETLEVLKLNVNLDIDPHVPIHLPNLKILHLSAFCPIDGLVTDLVSSCLSLEDLFVLSYRQQHKDQVINISSASLRRLVVNLDDEFTDRDTPAAAVVINTPNLEHFAYIDNILAQQFFIASMNDLLKAEIALYHYTSNDKETAFQQMLNFLRLSSNVQHLSLLDWSLQALHHGDIEGKLPVFHHLKTLQLGPEMMDMGPVLLRHHKLILELLRCSPFLEILHFSEGLLECNEPGIEELPEWRSQCCKISAPNLSSCGSYLKRITVNQFCGTEEELKLLEFLLRHALVLEELVIHGDPTEELETRLKMLPRASIKCSVMFYPCSTPMRNLCRILKELAEKPCVVS